MNDVQSRSILEYEYVLVESSMKFVWIYDSSKALSRPTSEL